MMLRPTEFQHIDPACIREPLHEIYDELDATISALAPKCELSGRCCRFAEYGHTLFVSAVEFALLLADSPPALRPVDDGLTCPWQDFQGRCTARGARPLGCRVYFCDPTFESQAGPITETYLARIRALADAQSLPWSYLPLHYHLKSADGIVPLGNPSGFPEAPKEVGLNTQADRRVREIT